MSTFFRHEIGLPLSSVSRRASSSASRSMRSASFSQPATVKRAHLLPESALSKQRCAASTARPMSSADCGDVGDLRLRLPGRRRRWCVRLRHHTTCRRSASGLPEFEPRSHRPSQSRKHSQTLQLLTGKGISVRSHLLQASLSKAPLHLQCRKMTTLHRGGPIVSKMRINRSLLL